MAVRRFDFGSAPSAHEGDWLAEEGPLVAERVRQARLDPAAAAEVQARAVALVRQARSTAGHPGLAGALDRFLLEYDLNSAEGVLLLCLAEALLRIPDPATADELIADKLGPGRWREHLGDSDSLLINASTWALLLTGRLLAPQAGRLEQFMARLGEPVIRAALRQAMRILGEQFVTGQDIEAALASAATPAGRRYRHSFDMLGEAAITRADARRYLASYHASVGHIAAAARPLPAEPKLRPGLSVKLSALHPRYELAQRERVLRELLPDLLGLVEAARAGAIPLTVDAEESDRLGLSLELVAAVFDSGLLRGYDGFGLAVQAYQKRAPAVLDWLIERARHSGVRLSVRLVKGAYWDSEIKRAQERGLEGFPVYTRKAATDVSWLACARRLVAAGGVIYPQFATHNAHSVAYVLQLCGERPESFEFQRLQGMGEALYDPLVDRYACRVYAPVGTHHDLLPYLVRRLLENGANTSFVNRVVDQSLTPEAVVRDPVSALDAVAFEGDPRILAPRDLFAPERRNSGGLNLVSPAVLRALQADCASHLPDIEALRCDPVEPADVDDLYVAASKAQAGWEALGVETRAACLDRAAELLEANRAKLVACCVVEAARTVPDALDELREAVDLLRYYGAQARTLFGAGTALPGVAGESNTLRLRARGVFTSISPWNFPLSIFTGQLAAALVAGNAVIAKPAPQTPRCAALVTRLLHEAGVPLGVLQLAPGAAELGEALVSHPALAGVVFTGSTDTAGRIADALARHRAARGGALPPLIAETGGMNAIVADSSALPEQLVQDVLQSAFNSAGQRCSAARLLFVQHEIAPRVLELLAGAMDELVVGDPMRLETDVGPVIDSTALQRLREWRGALLARPRWHHESALADHAGPLAFAPLAAEISLAEIPAREVFGPVLHVLRFDAEDTDEVIDRVNALGYGLTLGLHTRIESRAARLSARARVGNVYVNRNIIGAVVGSQPFGGVGASGTGPKAGGPLYLQRFAWEQTVTTNTAAIGGNASLLAQPGADQP